LGQATLGVPAALSRERERGDAGFIIVQSDGRGVMPRSGVTHRANPEEAAHQQRFYNTSQRFNPIWAIRDSPRPGPRPGSKIHRRECGGKGTEFAYMRLNMLLWITPAAP
jgi:hypothetical protein